MMVLVETNFVIEIALAQGQASAARAILRLAQKSRIDLAMPAFVVGEALHAVIGKNLERSHVLQSLDNQLRELGRSRHRRSLVMAGEGLSQALAQVERGDMDRLQDTLRAVTRKAELIPIEATTLRDAIRYQRRYGLRPPDALIHASVVRHLRARGPADAVFVTRDDHFDDAQIKQELLRLHCAFVGDFANGLARIQSHSSG